MRRVKEVEARLNSIQTSNLENASVTVVDLPHDASSTHTQPMPPVLSHETPIPVQMSLSESDEEINVDALATEAFQEEAESDIGHFGTLS